MKIVLAPDSFKGNLTALQVATAFEKGIKRVMPNANCIKVPMADGGEGTVSALLDVMGGRLVRKTVTGSTGQPIVARYGILADGETAIIEMAAASGLPSITDADGQSVMTATTYGTGQLMLDAVNRGVNHIIVGLGGSATVDCGAGALQALGVKFFGKSGREIKKLAAGGMLHTINHIDVSNMNSKIREMQITLASDVENLLYGKQGAAYVFAPQKGATLVMVKKLDTNLRHFAGIIKRDMCKDVSEVKGSGAAGGLGGGLFAFTRARFKSGINIVIEATQLERHIAGADLVITGEGRVDFQTSFGKTPAGVAKVARKNRVQTIIIGGGLADDAHGVFDYGVDGLASAYARNMSLQEAMKHSKIYLANAAERSMRLVAIGCKIARKKTKKK